MYTIFNQENLSTSFLLFSQWKTLPTWLINMCSCFALNTAHICALNRSFTTDDVFYKCETYEMIYRQVVCFLQLYGTTKKCAQCSINVPYNKPGATNVLEYNEIAKYNNYTIIIQ